MTPILPHSRVEIDSNKNHFGVSLMLNSIEEGFELDRCVGHEPTRMLEPHRRQANNRKLLETMKPCQKRAQTIVNPGRFCGEDMTDEMSQVGHTGMCHDSRQMMGDFVLGRNKKVGYKLK